MLERLVTPLIILLVLLIWTFILVLLDRKGILEKFNMSRIWIFALMWRTKKGRGLIDKIASPKKTWIWIANFGFILFFSGMVLMFFMLALSAYFTVTSPLVQPVGAQEVLVLPGINPYVPFIFGIIGLIVAVVAHEFSHGIIARAEGFKVKALGLLFILIPVGAFMEPDEEEVEKGPRKSRMRMFTAGPMINFILAFIFLGIFSWGFMGSLGAEDDPLILTDIDTTSPFHIALDEHPKALYSIDGKTVHSYEDIYTLEGVEPGKWVMTEVKVNGGRMLFPVISGVMITNVDEDTPAYEAGLVEGSIILSVDGLTITNSEVFHEFMDETEPEQMINLTLLVPYLNSRDEIILNGTGPEVMPLNSSLDILVPVNGYQNFYPANYSVVLDDKYEHIPISIYKDKGYIGIGSTYMGVVGKGSEVLKDQIAHPISSADSFVDGFYNVIYITFRLPLDLKIMPFHDPLTDIYEVNGVMSILPEDLFWFLANTVFYIFWLNILLGLFNALPMIPLDGGFVFRDTMVLILGKIFKDKDEEELEKRAKTISKIASYTVLFFILTSVMFPWFRVWFLS
ncbi:MAG: site-2 protease family protein [Thermoplasmatota archaeon]